MLETNWVHLNGSIFPWRLDSLPILRISNIVGAISTVSA
jgi:hypothetical protein